MDLWWAIAHTRHLIIYCNNTLPRGGVYCKIRSLGQFASLGSRDSLQFQFILTRGSVLSFFFPERECIGNHPSNSQGVLTVYKFNTLPLKKNSYSLLYMTTVFRYKTFVCLQLFFVCELICLTWQESPKQSSSLSPLVHQRFSAQPACSSWSWSSPTSGSSPTF